MLAWPRVGPWLLTAAWMFAKQGVSQSTVPAPNIDFSSLGQVTIAGSFDAISVYEYEGQQQGFVSNGTQSVLAQLPSGFYEKLASTDASIETMCPFVLKDGTLAGVVVGGNFTSIGGVDTRSVAIIDPVTFAITPQVGIQGTVSALLCDQEMETVYVGGTFEAAGVTNAITWIAAGSWATLPFSGFDGPVTSIVKAPNGNIVFGGSFTGLGNGTSNSTSENTQVINLATASIISNSNTTSGNNIVCPPNSSQASGSPWLLQDNTPGSWQANLGYGFEPKRLRLWNTRQENRGTKTWRLTALPDGGIMNFTYIDPVTGDRQYCDNNCPLSNNASLPNPYQDFEFVNTVGMNSVRIDVREWYGIGGGLDGVELFQSDIFAYAIDAFNEPACSGTSTPSNATTTGAWRETPSYNSNTDYLTVVTGPTTVGSTDIVFEPDVQESGNYSIVVYTPGCLQDSSCSARAIVNVTGVLRNSEDTTFSTQVYQTNNFDKYDQVYQGYVDKATSGFRPRVTIRPSGSITDQLVVASRIRFNVLSTTGGLNGLFEFDPNSAVVNTDFSQSAINSAGTELRPNAHILAMTTHNGTVFTGGAFTDDSFQNIMSFADNQASSLPQGGLNAAVTDLYSSEDSDYLYVGGNFTGTNLAGGPTGLNNVAAYEYSTRQWVALGAGLDGPIEDLSPLPLNLTSGESELVVAFSGSFRNIIGTESGSNIPVDGLAIWVPSQKAWLESLTNVTRPALVGQLCAHTILPNNTWLGAGTLTLLGYEMSDVANLQAAPSGHASIRELPIQISASSTSSSNSSSMTKRALGDTQNVTGVTTGLYYYPDDRSRNVTVLGGHFTATGSDSATINNLLFLDASKNNEVTGLPAGIDNNSTFLTLDMQDDLLIAGGNITGLIGNARINGLVMYDLRSAAYRSVQPAGLAGDSVVVRAITTQPGTSSIYVGGTFDRTAQGLACQSVCSYDTSLNQWNSVGGLDGSVAALFWSSATNLIAAGNLSVSGSTTGLAVYDSKQQIWTAKSSSDIPGPVSAFTAGTTDGDRIWVAGTANNGSTFLMLDENNNFKSIVGYFDQGTEISGLQIIPVNPKNHNNDYLNPSQSLLITGSLNMTGFGQASAAIFDGSSLRPFLLASNTDGTAGSVSKLISSNPMKLDSSRPRHSRGIAILVALCAALGTIFLIVLLGILLNYIQRRRSGYSTIPTVPYADKHSNINRVPPERLFGTLGQRPGGAPTV